MSEINVIEGIIKHESIVKELHDYFKNIHESNCANIIKDRWFADWGIRFMNINNREEALNFLNDDVEIGIIDTALDVILDEYSMQNLYECYCCDYGPTDIETVRTFFELYDMYDTFNEITKDYKSRYFNVESLMEEWDEEHKTDVVEREEETMTTHENANTIIKHDCGNGYKVVMENYTWIDDKGMEHHEFLTYIEKDGIAWQDIAMVRFNDGKTPSVKVNVWAETDNEDYTHEFNIDVYEE